MITVFNRKEICTTYDLEEQNKIKSILKENNISYDIVAKNMTSPTPVALGGKELATYGLDLSHCIEYKIYVKKQDFETAMYLISTC